MGRSTRFHSQFFASPGEIFVASNKGDAEGESHDEEKCNDEEGHPCDNSGNRKSETATAESPSSCELTVSGNPTGSNCGAGGNITGYVEPLEQQLTSQNDDKAESERIEPLERKSHVSFGFDVNVEENENKSESEEIVGSREKPHVSFGFDV